MCCKCCGPTQRKVWVFGSGGLLLLSGILTIVLWPDFIRKMIQKSLILEEGSSTYEKWIEIPIPIYMDVYIYNWTNPDQIRNNSVKPNFEEIGPYVFLENRAKEDIVWNDNNTVSYWMARTWHFIPEMSNGTLEENITCPNMIAASMAHSLRHRNIGIKLIVNPILNAYGSLAVTKRAREWVFEGFDDPLIDMAKLFNVSSAPPVDKFGWFYGRNGSKTFEGRFEVRNGKDDISTLGDLTNWNGAQSTGFYEGECGTINGSTGDLWPPNMNPEKDISLYSVDLCRYLLLSPGPKETIHGIEGVKFWSTEMSLGNGDRYPNMGCFCPKDSDECPKTGVLDVSPCRYDAPAFVSFPHFYMADESYRDAITGMHPDGKQHRFSFTMEPSMAVPLDVFGSFQVNLELKPDKVFDIFKKIPKFLAPMMWMRERGGVDAGLAKELRLALNLPAIGVYIGIALTTLGAIILGVGGYLTFAKKWGGYDPEEERLT